MSIKRRFDVCAGRPYTNSQGEDKRQWVNVGRAIEWDDGGFSIELHAVPVGDWFDGKLSCFDADRDKPEKTQKPAQRQQAKPTKREAPPKQDEFQEDDIPF